MKSCLMTKLYGKVYFSMIKKDIDDKNIKKEIKKEYVNIMNRAKDIGKNNILLGSYTLAAMFIALNRKNNVGVEKNYTILENGMKHSKIFKIALGNGEDYYNEKKCAKRIEWSKQTKEHKYENDWVVEVAVDDENTYGLDYLECGVCKLCHDENCFELAKYLCKLDYLLADMMGLKLTRTMTIAEGCPKCDFRYSKIKK